MELTDWTWFLILFLWIIIESLEMMDRRRRWGKCPLLLPVGELVSEGPAPES